MNKLALTRTCIFVWSLSPVFGQISQDHPELCGDSGRFVAVPLDLSATINKANGAATLRAGPNHLIELRGVNSEIHQVCPLGSGRLVSFGFNVGYTVNVVYLGRGVVVDSWVAYDPVMSPNRRWIASRHFYAPQSEIRISEEYLLYDINASPSEKLHSVAPYIDAVGWAMYPAFPGGAPADLFDIPEARNHEWRSKSFFWAADSRSLVFADSVGDKLSLVLVLIPNNDRKLTRSPCLPELTAESGRARRV